MQPLCRAPRVVAYEIVHCNQKRHVQPLTQLHIQCCTHRFVASFYKEGKQGWCSVMTALAFNQCGLGSNTGSDAIRGLRL